ncbi:MAG TPA: hypothetical protein PLO67_14865 [Saprospiraceae bacterium]|nr:hypothetical protein [Saprospiraceae bacterium]HPI06869.1 hypothetical protein [Saprospiraceae bacterium]
MQRKFDSDDPSERFPFREEYWEQAQALIEADERRRKRRRLLFWWLFSGMLAGIAAIWLWSGQTNGPSGVASINTHNSEQTRSITPGPETGTPGTTESTGTSDDASSSISETTIRKNIDNQYISTENPTEKPALKQDNEPENQRMLHHKTPASKLPHNRNALPDKALKTRKNVQGSRPENDMNVGANAETGVPAPVPGFTVQPENNRETRPNASVEADAVPPSSTVLIAGDATAPPILIRLLEALELPFPPAHYLKNLSPRKIPSAPKPEIRPVHTNRFAWEAGAAASAWQAGTGFAGGFAGSYSLHGHWSLAAGVQVRYVPLTAVAPVATDSTENVSVQYRYSFGVERTESKRLVKNTVNLELPISAHWQKGRLGWSAGVAPGILLGARNTVVQTKETTLGGVQTLDGYTEKGQKAGFRNTYISLFGSAEWRVLPHVGLSFQGNYRPGSILKPAENVAPKKNFWFADLGVRWHF